MSVPLDYSLTSSPRIDLATFTGVLRAARSPMVGEARGVYEAFTARGIDPAVGLAIAQRESGFGTLGIAVGRNNPFGSRFYRGMDATNDRGWASFTSYTAAARYTAGLLAGPRYAGSANASTARTFPTVYAPAGDGNRPSAYGEAIVRAITSWTGGRGAVPYERTARDVSTGSVQTVRWSDQAVSAADWQATFASRARIGLLIVVLTLILIVAL